MTKRKSISRKTRRLVRERAGNRCEYCLHPDSHTCAFFAGDHAIPRAAGAGDTLDDLAWACPYCNNHKYAKTQARDPKTGRIVPLFNPRRQKWSAHFKWSDGFQTIVGKTAIGRATVEALHLNREERINLRRALIAVGEHPPNR